MVDASGSADGMPLSSSKRLTAFGVTGAAGGTSGWGGGNSAAASGGVTASLTCLAICSAMRSKKEEPVSTGIGWPRGLGSLTVGSAGFACGGETTGESFAGVGLAGVASAAAGGGSCSPVSLGAGSVTGICSTRIGGVVGAASAECCWSAVAGVGVASAGVGGSGAVLTACDPVEQAGGQQLTGVWGGRQPCEERHSRLRVRRQAVAVSKSRGNVRQPMSSRRRPRCHNRWRR